MNQPTKRILFFMLAMIVLLAACAPAAVPTQDPQEIEEQIAESVALTVAAQNAQATERQAQIVPSNTPLPTQTEAVPPTPTPILPTATPFVIVPPTNTVAPSGGGGGGSVVPTERPLYACDITNRRPFDNTIFKPNDEFDIRWTIINTGTRTLREGLDLEYVSGPNMTSKTFVELPELSPGETYEVIFDAVAPSREGFHVMTWRVEGPLCFPYVAINVERP